MSHFLARVHAYIKAFDDLLIRWAASRYRMWAAVRDDGGIGTYRLWQFGYMAIGAPVVMAASGSWVTGLIYGLSCLGGAFFYVPLIRKENLHQQFNPAYLNEKVEFIQRTGPLVWMRPVMMAIFAGAVASSYPDWAKMLAIIAMGFWSLSWFYSLTIKVDEHD